MGRLFPRTRRKKRICHITKKHCSDENHYHPNISSHIIGRHATIIIVDDFLPADGKPQYPKSKNNDQIDVLEWKKNKELSDV